MAGHHLVRASKAGMAEWIAREVVRASYSVQRRKKAERAAANRLTYMWCMGHTVLYCAGRYCTVLIIILCDTLESISCQVATELLTLHYSTAPSSSNSTGSVISLSSLRPTNCKPPRGPRAWPRGATALEFDPLRTDGPMVHIPWYPRTAQQSRICASPSPTLITSPAPSPHSPALDTHVATEPLPILSFLHINNFPNALQPHLPVPPHRSLCSSIFSAPTSTPLPSLPFPSQLHLTSLHFTSPNTHPSTPIPFLDHRFILTCSPFKNNNEEAKHKKHK